MKGAAGDASEFGSVPGDGRIDGAGPGVDAAAERLGKIEALIAEPHSYAQRAGSVMAEDDDRLVGIEFGMGAGGDLAHGHEERPGKAGGLKLPRFADVDKDGRGGLLTLARVGVGGDFGIKYLGHGRRISLVLETQFRGRWKQTQPRAGRGWYGKRNGDCFGKSFDCRR